MANIYEVDFEFQVDRLTPPRRRTPKLLAYLFSLVAPLQTFNNAFCNYVTDTILSTRITGQVIVLEEVLTQALNIETGDPRVIIKNFEVQDDFTIGAIEDTSAGIFSDESFADSGITATDSGITSNFVVLVPSAVWSGLTDAQKQEFRSIIDTYKLYATFYVIQTY